MPFQETPPAGFDPADWRNYNARTGDGDPSTPDNRVFKQQAENGLAQFAVEQAQAALASTGTLDLSAYSLVGDGATDDATQLQQVISDAIAIGKRLVLAPGKVYAVGSQVLVSGTCRIEWNGASIKKLAALTIEAIKVTGSNVVLADPVIDGNRASGSTGGGIDWRGTGGRVVGGEVHHCAGGGVVVRAGDLRVWWTKSHDHASTVAGNADGFYCENGARIECWFTQADSNDRNGYYLIEGAQAGCIIAGTATRNARAGLAIRNSDGRIAFYRGVDNDRYGLLADGAASPTGWTLGDVECIDTGRTAGISSGTGVELIGCSHFNGKVVSKGNLGYALAIAGGSTYNDLELSADRSTSGAGADPALHLSGGSKYNTVRGTARGYTVGCILGEGTTGNDHNTIVLVVEDCTGSCVHIDGGAHNTLDITARNVTLADTTFRHGFLNCAGSASHDNVFRWFSHADDRGVSTFAPDHVLWCDASAYNNRVLDGQAVGHIKTALRDLNGANALTLRSPRIRRTLAAFEASETWTGGVADATADHYAEGAQGIKLTAIGAAGAITGAARSISSTDLSSIFAASDWMRIRMFVQNVAHAPSGSAAQLRLYTTASSDYFTISISGANLIDGVNAYHLRPSDFAVVGSPSWSTITKVEVRVIAGSSPDFAVTFDEWVLLDDAYGPIVLRAKTPPTSGSFQRGDRVDNPRPQSGEALSWVCIADGSPGSWQAVYPGSAAAGIDFTGTGTPEGVITSTPGATYRRSDAPDVASALYVKASGSGNTGWRKLSTFLISKQSFLSDGKQVVRWSTPGGRKGCAMVDLNILTGSQVYAASIEVEELDAFTKIGFYLGSVGLTIGTDGHGWLFVYSNDGTSLLAQSDDLNAGGTGSTKAANTALEVTLTKDGSGAALASGTLKPPSGDDVLYAALLCVPGTGGVLPRLRGNSYATTQAVGNFISGLKTLAAAPTATVTTPPSSITLTPNSSLGLAWLR